MKKGCLIVRTTAAPVVEIDCNAQAAYIRFGRSRTVSKTIELSQGPGPFVAVDLDEAEAVLGVELVGVQEFTIGKLLKMAPAVQTRNVDFSRTRYVPAVAV